MTTIDNITEAIKRCDEVKARLVTLQDMVKPKLRIKHLGGGGEWTPSTADDLDCQTGVVILGSDGFYYYKVGNDGEGDWQGGDGRPYTCQTLLDTLLDDVANCVTHQYTGDF